MLCLLFSEMRGAQGAACYSCMPSYKSAMAGNGETARYFNAGTRFAFDLSKTCRGHSFIELP